MSTTVSSVLVLFASVFSLCESPSLYGYTRISVLVVIGVCCAWEKEQKNKDKELQRQVKGDQSAYRW